MKYIGTGFSPKMLNPTKKYNLKTSYIKNTQYKQETRNKTDIINCIGHDNIAQTIHTTKNRINIRLEDGDTLYILQNHGYRQTLYNYKNKQKKQRQITKIEVQEIK